MKIAKRFWSLNWKIYQSLKPLMLIISSIISLTVLSSFGLKVIIPVIVLLWILVLAFYDYLKEAAK